MIGKTAHDGMQVFENDCFECFGGNYESVLGKAVQDSRQVVETERPEGIRTGICSTYMHSELKRQTRTRQGLTCNIHGVCRD